jgi:hypothetical protein
MQKLRELKHVTKKKQQVEKLSVWSRNDLLSPDGDVQSHGSRGGMPVSKGDSSVLRCCGSDCYKTMRVYVDIYVWSRDHIDHA